MIYKKTTNNKNSRAYPQNTINTIKKQKNKNTTIIKLNKKQNTSKYKKTTKTLKIEKYQNIYINPSYKYQSIF